MGLANKVCVVVGASGAIGSAVARRFYVEGARVALTFLTVRPQKLLEELKCMEETGGASPDQAAVLSFFWQLTSLTA